MDNELSKREIDVMQAIQGYINENTFPPAVRDICKIISIDSTSMVRDNLLTLENKGYIKRSKKVPRSIKVLRNI